MEFEGFTEKQEEIIKEPLERMTILSGAVRSGKTFLTYFILPMLLDEFGLRARGLLMGKTLGTIEENILKPMRELYGDIYIGDMKSDATGNRYVSLFGAKIRCVGANDKKSDGKIRGSTYSWAICDEVATYPVNVFDMLMSRLSEPNAKCVCTTNPEDPNHWLKKRFIDNDKIKCKVYSFTIDDNPLLEKSWVENLKNIYSGTELYDRYILGQWVSSNGAIYKKFVTNAESAILTDIDRNELADCAIGIDFGENVSPTAFVCVGLLKNYKGIVILEEQKITDHGDVRLLESNFTQFVNRCYNSGWKPSRVYYDVAQWTLGRSLESSCYRSGLPLIVKECTKDKIKDRIYLEQVLFGKGSLKILKHCELMIKAFKEAIYSDKGMQDERLDIVGSDNPVDMLDAFEYAIQRWGENLLKMTLYGG